MANTGPLTTNSFASSGTSDAGVSNLHDVTTASHSGAPPSTLRVWDTPLVWLAPRRLFARVEDVATFGWPLAILLLCVTLVGHATVQTGLIERDVERSVAERIALIDQTQRDVLDRSALRTLYDEQRKQGEFEKTMARLMAIAAQPVGVLASTLLIAAVLFGAVAMSGRKPEWNTLLNLCVYAGFIELLRLAATLAMRIRFRTLEADTSLSPVGAWLANAWKLDPEPAAALIGALGSADPFRVWFWWVVWIGLCTTRQLPPFRGALVCVFCWLTGAATSVLLAMGTMGAG